MFAFEAGMRAMDRGAYESAVRHFQTALGEDPEDALAHAMISIALANVGRRHAALVVAGRALSLEPELPVAHVAEAYARVLHHDDRAADAAFARALALDPHHAPALLGRARVARSRRDTAALEAALAAYRAVVPDDPECEVLAAHLHLMRGDVDRAEAAARAALAADPEDADGYTALGLVHARRGDTARARQMALTALAIAPDNEDAHHLLAQATMQEKPVLGRWHRFSLWMSLGGGVRVIAVLIGMWVVFRAGVAILDEAGLATAAGALQLVWLGFVLMTWMAGFQYRRLLERELERAGLNPDY